jgi:hypothetical protein
MMSAPLAAQWKHPTAGIPRLPDAKPRLNPPAPKTADGKPDINRTLETGSRICWQHRERPQARRRSLSAREPRRCTSIGAIRTARKIQQRTVLLLAIQRRNTTRIPCGVSRSTTCRSCASVKHPMSSCIERVASAIISTVALVSVRPRHSVLVAKRSALAPASSRINTVRRRPTTAA